MWYDNDNVCKICPNLRQERFSFRQDVELNTKDGWTFTKVRSGGIECAGGGGLATKSCPILASTCSVALHTPLSMGFSRQEYWSGLPFASPGELPNPGIKQLSPVSPALQADSLPTEPHQDKNHFPFLITVQFLSYSASCLKITIQTLSISSPVYAPLFSSLLIIKK